MKSSSRSGGDGNSRTGLLAQIGPVGGPGGADALAQALRRYHGGRTLSQVRAFGLKANATAAQRAAWDDLIEAERLGFLDVTYNDVIFQSGSKPDEEIEVILAQAGIGTFAPHTKGVARRLVEPLYQWILDVGDYIETLPKAAAIYKFADRHGSIADIPPDVRDFIQRKAGSPMFKEGGTHTPVSNNLLLFSNAFIQGTRADLEIGLGFGSTSEAQSSRAEFWWKNAKLAILPAFLTYGFLYLADHGDEDDPKTWVGRALKNIPEYDLANYLCLPLWITEEGDTVYLRTPMSDFGRLLHGMTWKLLHLGDENALRAALDIVDYSAGQLPSLSPYLEVPGDVTQFLSGGRVYDPFRDRFLLTEDEAKSTMHGDLTATKKFLGYEFQKLGGGIVWKFYPGEQRPRQETGLTKFLGTPIVSNIVGRWLKVSHYGQVERLRRAAEPVAAEEASRRLTQRAAVNDLVREYQQLSEADQTDDRALDLARTLIAELYPDVEEQDARWPVLRRQVAMGIARVGGDALTDAVLSATSNAQKTAILVEGSKSLGHDRFLDWLDAARREGLVSKPLEAQILEALGEPAPARR